MKKSNISNQRGFTLVEIMIVVVIIGLLAGLAIPSFQKVRYTSQDKTIFNNLRQLSAASQQYFLEMSANSVSFANLVGTETNKYVRRIQTVRGETYPTSFAATDTQYTVDGVVWKP